MTSQSYRKQKSNSINPKPGETRKEKKMKKVYSKTLNKTFIITWAATMLLGVLAHDSEASGITVYKDGDKYVKMGGRIQLQYHYKNPDDGESSDEIFFRRLRPYIEGSIHKDWKGKFQVDFGKSEVAIKDAYMQYSGLDNMKITIGNANFSFSRELLTSSKKQQLVERTFVGDHNYGTPDRQAGIHLTGHAMEDKMLTWGFSVAAADIDPDVKKLDFDTPVNVDDDFNQGWIYGGRIDFHPFGMLKFEQGDFKKKTKTTVGVAAFGWTNDDDNNTFTDASGNITATGISKGKADVDKVTGFEISAAFRSSGISIDAEYNLFKADTVDPTFTGGIYQNGSTELKNWAVEGGYMLPGNMFEIGAGYESQDADNYDDEWTRLSFFVNVFFSKNHDIKTQLTYRKGENLKGVSGSDEDEAFLQVQYVF
jgi:hypothetical protein